ncbi:MAG: flagellar FliJ family protein [Candidatus Acidiferrum sp.]
MAFRYPLQPLLRLRESLERQEEQRLFASAAVVSRLRAEIERLHEAGVEAQREALQEMSLGSPGALLQFAASCEAAFRSACRKLQLQLDEAERKRLLQLRAYQAVRQKREILQGLRERQEAAYQLEFARHEQQTADESFLIRLFSTSSE